MTIKSRYQELARALKGDGCTSAPDLHYRHCCDEHDVYYRQGQDADGQPVTRAEADRRLRLCMRAAGKTPVFGRWLLPWVYWSAVRLFGRRAWHKSKSSDSVATPSAPVSSPE